MPDNNLTSAKIHYFSEIETSSKIFFVGYRCGILFSFRCGRFEDGPLRSVLTAHEQWPDEEDAVHEWKKKKGKRNTSHRYNLLLLLPSDPGRIQRELVV